MNKLARALGVATSELFGTSGRPVARRESPTEVPLLALRQALFPARRLDGGPLVAVEATAPSLADVRAAVHAVDATYHADDYA